MAPMSTDPPPPGSMRMPLSTMEIMAALPHRYPFLLVDRIVECDDVHVVGLKQVSANEPFFQGHFPGRPIMPGVLLIEALAQTGAVSILLNPANVGKLAVLTGADAFRFRRQVVPGDTVRLEVTVMGLRSNFGRARGRATVDGELAAEGDISFALVPAQA